MKKKGAVSNKITCVICQNKNRLYSDYCFKCGHEFTEEEKEFAKNHTVYACLDKLENITENKPIKKFVKNRVVRFVAMIIFILLALFTYNINGKQVKLLSFYKYDINYSDYYDEYYIMIDKDVDEVDLKLYVPEECKKITVEHYDDLNMIINEEEFDLTDDIKLKPTYKDYYLLNVTYKDNTKTYLKINVRNKKIRY